MPPPQQLLQHARQAFLAGDFDRAQAISRQILLQDPYCAEPWFCLGLVADETGDPAEAEGCYRRALALEPRFPAAHNNLGKILIAQGLKEEAAECFRHATQQQPDDVGFRLNLAHALAELDRDADALDAFRAVLLLDPDQLDAHREAARLLFRLRRYAEAAEHRRHLLRLIGRLPETLNDLAVALVAAGDFDAAAATLDEALAMAPEFPATSNHLGICRLRQGRVGEAIGLFDRAVELESDYADARLNRGCAHLLQGDLARGWPDYEWRFRVDVRTARDFPQPRWDGSPQPDSTLLVWCEQGLGDVLQFIRYAPIARRHVGRLVVLAPARLIPLLKTCPGIDRLVPQDEPPGDFDLHAPLASLPAILGSELKNLPSTVPYLSADPQQVGVWRGRLAELGGFRVGIAWQGTPQYREDHRRSIPLERFSPLAEVEGVTLVSLQKGYGAEQLEAISWRDRVIDLGCMTDAHDAAFLDTAAVMENLDLLIVSDSAVAHLAGALARPVWLALPAVPDWRWLMEVESSPWYPTMTLFRQLQTGDWKGVFERIADRLAGRVQKP